MHSVQNPKHEIRNKFEFQKLQTLNHHTAHDLDFEHSNFKTVVRMPIRIGIIPHLYAQPLFEGLREAGSPARLVYELVEDNPAQIALMLREGTLHGAFLSPIE